MQGILKTDYALADAWVDDGAGRLIDRHRPSATKRMAVRIQVVLWDTP
jgi:hypothetical protein